MLRFVLGSWTVAGVVIGSLLTAVAQNPPPVPDGDAESQQQEQDGQSPTDSSQPASQNQQNQAERPDSADQPQPARQESPRGQQRQGVRGTDAVLAGESEDATDARNDLGIQFRTSNSGGLMIASLDRRGGASASGLREGDLIVSAGGRTFESEQALREFLIAQSDQQQIPIVVMRDGRRETVFWSSNQPADQAAAENGSRPRMERRFVQRPTIADEIRQHDLESSTGARAGIGSRASIGVRVVDSQWGPHVAEVIAGSPAAVAGLREGDFIIRLDGERYRDSARFAADVSRSAVGQPLGLDIYRDGQMFSMQIRPESYATVYGRETAGAGQAIAERQQPAGSPQRREAARPNFDLGRRVEQLESEVDALRRQVEFLRERMSAIDGDQPAGEHGDGTGSAKRPD